jgi:hypothetical protein
MYSQQILFISQLTIIAQRESISPMFIFCMCSQNSPHFFAVELPTMTKAKSKSKRTRNTEFRTVVKKHFKPIKSDDIYRCLAEAIGRGSPPSDGKSRPDSVYDQGTRKSAHSLFRGRDMDLSISNMFEPHLGAKKKRILWRNFILITEDEEDPIFKHFYVTLRKEMKQIIKKQIERDVNTTNTNANPTTGIMFVVCSICRTIVFTLCSKAVILRVLLYTSF